MVAIEAGRNDIRKMARQRKKKKRMEIYNGMKEENRKYKIEI